MRLIDANVILRYMLRDQEDKAEKAREVILGGAYTTTEVLVEVVYVLGGVYHAEREEIRDWVTLLLDDVYVENSGVMKFALRAFADSKLDFVDCLLLGYHRILGADVFTFDRKLMKRLETKT